MLCFKYTRFIVFTNFMGGRVSLSITFLFLCNISVLNYANVNHECYFCILKQSNIFFILKGYLQYLNSLVSDKNSIENISPLRGLS